MNYDKRSLHSMVKRLEKLNTTVVDVGFIDDTYGAENNGLNVASVALWQEFGTRRPGSEIPPRPFMHDTFLGEGSQKAIEAPLEKMCTDLLVGGGKRSTRLLERLGDVFVERMKANIIRWNTPSNNKKWASIKGKNDPLRYTDVMLNSVKRRVR